MLACIALDPEVRVRDIATTVGITERRAYGIVNDLAEAGCIIKEKEGRRNRYHIGELMKFLVGSESVRRQRSKRI